MKFIQFCEKHGFSGCKIISSRSKINTPCSSGTAFTLVELLVIIAIIGILAGLLFPAYSGARKRVQQAHCLSNFRQVGIALKIYIDDNSDWLPPGPVDLNDNPNALSESQAPVYGEASVFKKWLPYYLAADLSLPPPTAVGNTTNRAKVFFCPSYVSEMPNNSVDGAYLPEADNFKHAFSYSVTRSLTGQNSKYILPSRPFGEEDVSQALKLSAIQAVASLSDVWAMADFDTNAVIDPSLIGKTTEPYVAKFPVHGQTRNFLYFDNHVTSVKVTGPKDY